MPHERFARLSNAESIGMTDVPVLGAGAFRRAVIEATRGGGRISALFAVPRGVHDLRVFAVIANDERGDLAVCATDVTESFDALTPDCPQAHWFERELAEQWGIEPRGHPCLKPIRFQPPPGGKSKAQPLCGVMDYYTVEGEEVHEVAVGPVHAGVIEPGHFRFQCYGEEVLHLEISLGYQHRGAERALGGGPDKRTIHYIETLAGDTTVGHAHAYCQAVEAIAGINVPPRGMAIRGVALELERIANHIGDLGALAGDVGFLPTASYCGRIRGDVLNLTATVCGSRFGRSLLRPGGVSFDLNDDLLRQLMSRLGEAARDTANADTLLWESPSVMARFEGTGLVPVEICEEIGLVGPAARACGIDRDVRKDHPFGIYRYAHIPSCTWNTGDVFGRAHIRSIEIQRAFSFVHEQLEALPSGEVRADRIPALAPNRLAVSLIEGWRGEICHVAITDGEGRFVLYKVVDPSFHNWFGLAYAMRGQQISDFPLCNKSFNLSYCGHDL
jgi:Ni,Fe-hydrogenase III large subunit